MSRTISHKTAVLDMVSNAHVEHFSVLAGYPPTRTKSSRYSSIAMRMYLRYTDVERLGKTRPSGDNIEARGDLSPWQVLTSYIARKIYITEKHKRNGYMFDEVYQMELKFTKTLWKIYCLTVFDEILPELPVPTSYEELYQLSLNKESIMSSFNITNVVLSAELHSSLMDESVKNKFDEVEFNHVARLPSSDVRCWTKLHALRSANDGRHEGIEPLMRISMGLFKYDAMKSPEPYKNFWKGNAYKALDKFLVRQLDSIITKLKYAVLYDTIEPGYNNDASRDMLKRVDWYVGKK